MKIFTVIAQFPAAVAQQPQFPPALVVIAKASSGGELLRHVIANTVVLFLEELGGKWE